MILQDIIQKINTLAGDNQFLGGAIGVWLLGVITYMCRSIPMSIYTFLKKQLTTTVTATSYNICFYDILTWIDKKGYANKFRRIKLSNGRYGTESQTCKSIGYGRHFFWFKYRPILIQLDREKTDRNEDKEIFTFIKAGRSHRLFEELFQEISRYKETSSTNNLCVYVWRNSYFRKIESQQKRSIDSVYLRKDIKSRLINSISGFIDKEDFYIDHGIPYHLGIVLYGPPGTGKTSLVKALASYLNKRLYILKANDLHELGAAANELDENSILLVEDFDTYSPVGSRKTSKSYAQVDEPKEMSTKAVDDAEDNDIIEFFNRFAKDGLSTLLNELDGITSTHGRIAIFTTNHLDHIDSAVLRPGRIDLKLEIGYVDNEAMDTFLKAFFNRGIADGYKLAKKNLTVAELQKDILEDKTYDYFLFTYCTDNVTRKVLL